MITIKAEVTSTNNIIIDPGVRINSGNINGYRICFTFQVPWDENYSLYAVIKPVFDVPIKVSVTGNSAIMPPVTYKRFSKVGIGLLGQRINENGEVVESVMTALKYVEVVKGV